MALLVTFVAIDKSDPPEAKKSGKPTGGAEPRPYTHLSMACAYTFRANSAARPYALKCRRASPKSPSAPHFPKMQIIFYCGEKKPLIS